MEEEIRLKIRLYEKRIEEREKKLDSIETSRDHYHIILAQITSYREFIQELEDLLLIEDLIRTNL